ncbi:MAG TPA: lipoate--protein ligase family protein [Pirellulales bacterium]|nr:lipoate--protein ligase family protein [Pirellulales bacterium]
MRRIDLTLPLAEENLALDEALLDEAEAAGVPCECLRLWEPSSPMVVVGRSSRVAVEVRQERCRALGIPVLRRSSGGGAIVTGPGCLMYAVVLSLQSRPALRAIDSAHRFVLESMAAALRRQGLAVEHSGTSDLTLDNRKFSGNSLRVRREHLLYHGTLLYDFDVDLIGACLGSPPRQPEYRAGREHPSFVTNLPLTAAVLRRLVAGAWGVDEAETDWPRERVAELVAAKYSRREWNSRY